VVIRSERFKVGEFLRDLRFRIEYVGLRCVIAIVRLMPLSMASTLLAKCWRFLAPRLNRKRHQLALDNLAIVFPDKSPTERQAICLAHWENVGRMMAETMQIDRLINDPSRIKVVGYDILSRYIKKLGPAIGVSLHMGNWELGMWPFTAAGTNPAAVYRSMNNPYFDRFLRKQRERLYPGGMFGRGVKGDDGDDVATARAITHHVRQGGRIGIICDQFYRRGIPVSLFGRETKTHAIAAMIARRLGVRIWIGRCIRVGNQSRFRIESKELWVPRTSNPTEDVRTIMTHIYRQFEDWIVDTPEQWMWSNRKWTAGPMPSRKHATASVRVRQANDSISNPSDILRDPGKLAAANFQSAPARGFGQTREQ
jgi:KDO2-lipid IV(A) lauroyltransferase